MQRCWRLRRGYFYVLAWALGTACAAGIAGQCVHRLYGGNTAGADGALVIVMPRGKIPAGDGPTATPSRRSSNRPAPTSPDPSPTRASHARTMVYNLTGGVVRLTQTPTSARLAAARPDTGWRRRSWTGAGWLRVDFTKGDQVTTLIATWNGHPTEVRYINHT